MRGLLKPFGAALRRDGADDDTGAEEWRVSTRVDDDALAGAFADAYGAPPAGIWRAPGRVNLMGDHTAVGGGLVLPVALPLGVSMAVEPTHDGTVEARSLQRPGDAVHVSIAEPDPKAAARSTTPGWGRHITGVVRAARESGHLDADAGARILIDSDLPVRAGLASSAALESATLLALAEAHGVDGLAGDRRAMADLARRADTAFARSPTDGTGHHASLRCKEGHALFLDRRTGGGRNVALDLAEAGLRLLLIDTGVRPRPRDTEHLRAQRRTECARAAKRLGVDALRDVENLASALEKLKQPVLRKRVRHVVTEIHRVNAVVGLMRAKALPEIGAVLTASHFSLRDQFEVSCPELDLAVETAVRAGARGAKLTGTGLGGCAIALVPEESVDEVSATVSSAFAKKGLRVPEVRSALPSAGARRTH
nr:galactokinase family protein [Nocardiopsis mwathae]